MSEDSFPEKFQSLTSSTEDFLEPSLEDLYLVEMDIEFEDEALDNPDDPTLVELDGKKPYTEDSVKIYLQEISLFRSLKAEEEIELGKKINDLRYLELIREDLCKQLKREPNDREWAKQVWKIEQAEKALNEKADKTLKKADINNYLEKHEDFLEEQWSLQSKINFSIFRRRLYLNRKAKDKMVQSNLHLVISIAKHNIGKGLDFLDLIQAGNLGLIRAAEGYKYEKSRFRNYAYYWIRHAITGAITSQSRTIRLPTHLCETISRIKKTTKVLSQEMNRKPTEEEITDRMEMTIEKLRFIVKSVELTKSPTSWETLIEQEENSLREDLIDTDNKTPEEIIDQSLLREAIENILDTLLPQERDVLRLRYGLDDGRMKILEEIGQIFNTTREQIRRIEAKALRKLRHPRRNQILKEFVRGGGYVEIILSPERKEEISQILGQWKEYINLSKTKVEETLSNNPSLTNQEIALLCKVSEEFVLDVRQSLIATEEELLDDSQVNNQKENLLDNTSEKSTTKSNQSKNKLTKQDPNKNIKNKILLFPKWSDLEVAISCGVSESEVATTRELLYAGKCLVENLQSSVIKPLRNVYMYLLEDERKSVMDILKSIRKLEKELTRKYNKDNANKIINEIKKEEEKLMQIIARTQKIIKRIQKKKNNEKR